MAGLEQTHHGSVGDFEVGLEAGGTPTLTLVGGTDSQEDHHARVESVDTSVAAFNQSHLVFLDHLTDILSSELWLLEGSPSLPEWLASRYKFSLYTARILVKVASKLGELPNIRCAFESGRLSWDQLKALADVATADTDSEWAEQAVGLTSVDIRKLQREVSPSDEDKIREERSVTYWFDETEPRFEMNVSLPYDEGATLITALTRKADQIDFDPHDGLPMPHRYSMATALLQMASESLSADADHDRATLLVRADIETVLNVDGAPQATIGDGTHIPRQTPITNETLRRLICDARIQLVVEDPTNGVVGIGRTSRTIPPWLTRVVRARDRGCMFPDCSRTKWTQIHHIIHWANGGPTNLDNLITLCGFHHRLIHHDGWAIKGNPNHEVKWINKWGHEFRQHPQSERMESFRRVRPFINPMIPPRPPPRRS